MAAPVTSCTIQIRVRYAETDAMGFLHHARYFVYFEEGRTELLRRCGVNYRDMEERGLFYVVARLECRYRAPARYDDVLDLTTKTTRLTRSRVDHTYQLSRSGVPLAEANSTLALIGPEKRPTPLPDDLHAILTGVAANPGDG